MTFASLQKEFAAYNTELVGLSVDGLYSHIAWLRTIKDKIAFRDMRDVEVTFPLIDDVSMEIAQKYGMIMPGEDSTKAVRAVFVIDPKAVMRWHLPQEPGAPIGLWRGVLVQGGQIKAKLTASRSQGYGYSYWNHADSTARSEYLIPFIGRQPAYSLAAPTDVDGFFFSGLGSDFCYGGELSNRALIRAAEGIWHIRRGCRGFLMFNR